MGAYRSEPEENHNIENGETKEYKWAVGSMQGWRHTQEDAHIAITDMPNGEAIFGVFDGHGGPNVSQFVADNFKKVIVELDEYKNGDYAEALKKTFMAFDGMLKKETETIVSYLKKYNEVKDNLASRALSEGTTACVVLVNKKKLYCANAGDARAVIYHDFETKALSEDHKPENPDEKKRIEEAGGITMHNRVDLDLAVSRAIGDQRFKNDEDLKPEEQKVSCVPDIQELDLTEDSLFFMIACDGIWDCKSNEEAIEFMITAIDDKNEQSEDPGLHISKLFDECLSKDPEDKSLNGIGTDNMTCITVEFLW